MSSAFIDCNIYDAVYVYVTNSFGGKREKPFKKCFK